MGYDLGLFEGNEDEIVDDLICPICKGNMHRGVKSKNTLQFKIVFWPVILIILLVFFWDHFA